MPRTLIDDLRTIAEASDFQLNEKIIPDLGALISQSRTDGKLAHGLQTPEYGKPEYLLNCDTSGCAVTLTPSFGHLIENLRQPNPSWIKIDHDQVLVQRWLCHFIGFRHRAIHLFLDHPDHPDATFVQIRSLSKYNSPGLFDAPVGGHVDAMDSPRESLRKELGEELGLDDLMDLIEVAEIGTYNIAIPNFQPDYVEVEHTTLYRATIRPESVSKLRFQEGEVGGLVLFKRDELSRWIREFPDRVGGGLIDSWAYYS